MTQPEVVEQLRVEFAHLWMIRTFLKHADEIQEDEDMLEVPRTLFDYIRATEPSYERQDWAEFLRRARGKLHKLRKVEKYFADEHRRVSDHTNYAMASHSLTGAVRRIEQLLAATQQAPAPQPAPPESPPVGPVG